MENLQIRSLYDIIEILRFEKTSPKKKFSLLLGNFLDEIKKFSRDEINQALYREPQKYDHIPIEIYSYLSAVASTFYTSEIEDQPINLWFNNAKYVLENPYFPYNLTGKIRTILFQESPLEFKIRNIFISKNALTRV